jgi:hypothetical protein
MRTFWALLVVVAMAFLFTTADAGEKGEKGKEVKLTGKITCCKCDFDSVKAVNPDAKKPKVCVTVIIAKNAKGKETVYIFDKAGHKKYHGKVCREAMDGTVTGTVTKKGEARIITVDEVKFKE